MIGNKFFGVQKQVASGGIVAGATVNLDAGNASSYPGSGLDWFDLSGNNYNGQLISGVGYDSVNGGVLTFDGVNDYISFSPPQIINSATFTIECIFNCATPVANRTNYPGVFGRDTEYSDSFQFGLTPESAKASYGDIFFGSRVNYLRGKITRSNPLYSNYWYHIFLIKNGPNYNLTSGYEAYINNVSETIGTADAFAVHTGTNYIGNRQNTSGAYFNGKISVFNEYPFILTPEQRTQNFDFYKTRFSPSGYWDGVGNNYIEINSPPTRSSTHFYEFKCNLYYMINLASMFVSFDSGGFGQGLYYQDNISAFRYSTSGAAGGSVAYTPVDEIITLRVERVGTQVTIKVNGSTIGTLTTDSTTTAPKRIGIDNLNSYRFKGFMYDFNYNDEIFIANPSTGNAVDSVGGYALTEFGTIEQVFY